MSGRHLQWIMVDGQINERDHLAKAERQFAEPIGTAVKADQLEMRNLLGQLDEQIPAQIERAQRGHLAQLNGQVGDLVAADVELDELGEAADFLGQRDQAIIVHGEHLQRGQAAQAAGQIGQVV